MKIIIKKPIATLVALGVLIVLGGFALSRVFEGSEQQPQVITEITLEKIINVSQLSTFTAVYNGIATVPSPKDENRIDYYVSYQSKVNAGIDFEQVDISVDHPNKAVTITLPPVYITDINVDIGSLDYIFLNKKANTATSSEVAFKACEEDAKKESETEHAIFELATQNAKNILTALTRPILEQLDPEYTLVIETTADTAEGGAKQ